MTIKRFKETHKYDYTIKENRTIVCIIFVV